jgi:predicted house-cleaning noncanonical NTP pyrophosphatase (MazG superfamily)
VDTHEYEGPTETEITGWNEHNDHADGAEHDADGETGEFGPYDLADSADPASYGLPDSFSLACTSMHAHEAACFAGPGDPDGQAPAEVDLFAAITAVTAWLDTSNPDTPHEDSMRVLKLVEESGEAAQAYIGMVGQNPRKGVTHTKADLIAELIDVAVTALSAVQHFTKDEAATRGAVAVKLARMLSRSGLTVGPVTHRAKLVRDLVPEVIRESGAEPVTWPADESEYVPALRRKLVEEAAEAAAAVGRDALCAELADVVETVRALAEAADLTYADVDNRRIAKLAARGGFTGRTMWAGNVR